MKSKTPEARLDHLRSGTLDLRQRLEALKEQIKQEGGRDEVSELGESCAGDGDDDGPKLRLR